MIELEDGQLIAKQAITLIGREHIDNEKNSYYLYLKNERHLTITENDRTNIVQEMEDKFLMSVDADGKNRHGQMINGTYVKDADLGDEK